VTGIFAQRRWPSVLVALLVIASGIGLLVSYRTYDEWPWSTYPSQLHACGRDFQSSSRPQTHAQLIAFDSTDIVKVGQVPGWFNSGELWAYRNEQPFSGICRVVMFVRGGADEFESYELVGGP
jgi:hypothetical protein